MVDHVVGMTVLESCLDHLLVEVYDHSEDQETGNVDPEILTNDSQLVHSMEFWDVESQHVFHIVLETVDVVFLATGIAGPDLDIYDQATVVVDQVTVDEDLVTGNLGPVTGNDRLPEAFGIHGCLCPWVGTVYSPDRESSNNRRRIAPPTGQVIEPCIPGSLIPAGDCATVHEIVDLL